MKNIHCSFTGTKVMTPNCLNVKWMCSIFSPLTVWVLISLGLYCFILHNFVDMWLVVLSVNGFSAIFYIKIDGKLSSHTFLALIVTPLQIQINQQIDSCTGQYSTVHWRGEQRATGIQPGSWMSQRLLEIDTAGMALITLLPKWIIYQTQTLLRKSRAYFSSPG